ncbi:MAG: 50S ribosomal protein L10 [bacterium]|nr:50S ribosomal protein L10 [bacterium]
MAVRPEKQEIVKQLIEKYTTAKSVYFTEYRGLTVAELTQLRNQLRKAGCEFKVIKNTLQVKAFEQMKKPDFIPYFIGPIATAFSSQDPAQSAKVLKTFAKDHPNLVIKGGILDGKKLSQKEILAIADLPSREELLAKVFASMQAPIVGFLRVLNGPISGLVTVLTQIKKQKETAASAA